MILKTVKPLSSQVERTKTENLKIEYSPIRIPYYEDKCIVKGAHRARPIFRIKGSKSCSPPLRFKGTDLGLSQKFCCMGCGCGCGTL